MTTASLLKERKASHHAIRRDNFEHRLGPGLMAASYGNHMNHMTDESRQQLADVIGATLMKYATDPASYGEDPADWKMIDGAHEIEVISVESPNFVALVDGTPFRGWIEPFQRYALALRPYDHPTFQD